MSIMSYCADSWRNVYIVCAWLADTIAASSYIQQNMHDQINSVL